MPEHPTVLIVDDELGPRESLRMILFRDYHTLLAVDGLQALHFAKEEAVDVVLLDLHLPGLSGLHVLEELQVLKPTLAVIIVTGSVMYDTELERVREGPSRILLSPSPFLSCERRSNRRLHTGAGRADEFRQCGSLCLATHHCSRPLLTPFPPASRKTLEKAGC
jgi:DNA-binding NtrC family response regulator